MKENKLYLQPASDCLFILENTPGSIAGKIFKRLLLVFMGGIPVLLVLLAIFTSLSLSTWTLVGILFFIAMGIFILRSIVWGEKGKEIFTIQNGNLIYTSDYGKYKGRTLQIKAENTRFTYKQDYYKKQKWFSIILTNEKDTIESVIDLNEAQKDELSKFLSEWFYEQN